MRGRLTMKPFTEALLVKNETILEFLAWAEKQPKYQGKIVLTNEEVSEPGYNFGTRS